MLKIGIIVFTMMASVLCVAQDAVTPVSRVEHPALVTSVEDRSLAGCCWRVDGTPVTLEVMDPLNSALLKRGDKLRLSLVTP